MNFPELRIPRVLQAQLLGGEQPVFLRAELDEHGRATSATLTRPAVGDQVVENKVLARYLTPYLDAIRSRGRVPTAGASFH